MLFENTNTQTKINLSAKSSKFLTSNFSPFDIYKEHSCFKDQFDKETKMGKIIEGLDFSEKSNHPFVCFRVFCILYFQKRVITLLKSLLVTE